LAIGGGVLVVIVAVIAIMRPAPTIGPVPTPDGEQTVGAPKWSVKEPLDVGAADVAAASVWIDIAKPAVLKTVLRENAWLKRVGEAPLGRGFLGEWAGLLGTASDDVGLEKLSQGAIADLLTDKVFVQPVRVTFFEGWGGAAPVLSVTRPDAAVSTTYAAMTLGLERGGYTVDGCIGEPPAPTDTDADGKRVKNPSEIVISRLVVADKVVFAANTRGRLAFSVDARSLWNALCAPLPDVAARADADVVIAMAPAQVGRDAHALFGLLGLSDTVSLAMKVDGQRLIPVGIEGALKNATRLDSTPISDDTWALVPEDVPVVVGVNVRLPTALSTESLKKFYETGEGQTSTRQIVFVWQPHGDNQAPTDVAVIWSDPNDRAALETMFSGPNPMTIRSVCGRVVASSTTSLLSRIEGACSKAAPSVVFAEPAIKAGLEKGWSVGVIVDMGRLGAELMSDGYRTAVAKDPKKAPPPEIEQAKVLLRELPRMGFVGEKVESALRPRGFSS
jgi:hypothetical protein